MNKKILNYAIAACLIVPSAFSLAGCFNQNTGEKFTASQDVVSTTETVIENLTKNYYNASALGSNKTYSVEELKNNNEDFVYYVDIGTVENVEKLNKITIGDQTFNVDDTFSLSIGNANFISDKCFYEQENKIMVAAPIIAFETVNNTKIKINDKEFDFNFEKSATKSSFTNAKFSAGSTNTITKNEDNSYDANFKDAKTYLKFYYDNAAADDVVLTKRIIRNSENSKINEKANYGLTKIENEENYPLGLYPISYSQTITESIITTYNGSTIDYKAYIINKGVYETVINVNIETTENA